MSLGLWWGRTHETAPSKSPSTGQRYKTHETALALDSQPRVLSFPGLWAVRTSRACSFLERQRVHTHRIRAFLHPSCGDRAVEDAGYELSVLRPDRSHTYPKRHGSRSKASRHAAPGHPAPGRCVRTTRSAQAVKQDVVDWDTYPHSGPDCRKCSSIWDGMRLAAGPGSGGIGACRAGRASAHDREVRC